MDSSKLEKFATAARVTLLDQMAGLVTQALNDPKIAAEYPNDVTGLRAAVSEHGETWVADTAAHTWFNRLTAARFMDVRGYSGLYRVVSPAADSASNLPEILLRAQSGEFGDEVSERTQDEVSALLSGRRTSPNPELEAYALLLRAMFVAWYPSMPEVFTGPADWIRLLVPADLLAPTSVRERAVAVLDDDACATVEVVGWLYQFYNSDLKRDIDRSKAKVGARNIGPKTQLFTPDYIVKFLVENSLGRKWVLAHSDSVIRDHMTYFIDDYYQGDSNCVRAIMSPEDIRLVDPACGSGHILTYAFDLLYRIYEECGYSASSISTLILEKNLRGMEIDPRAAQLACFALAMKARERDRRFFSRKTRDGGVVRPDIITLRAPEFSGFELDMVRLRCSEIEIDMGEFLGRFCDLDSFGSLLNVDPEDISFIDRVVGLMRDHYLITADLDGMAALDLSVKLQALSNLLKALQADQYDVVVTNPPYLGSGLMDQKLRTFAKANYANVSADLYAMFIQKSVNRTRSGGLVSMVTRDAWMFISSYKKFRPLLPKLGRFGAMAHIGTRGFDTISGDIVQATAFVFEVGVCDNRSASFIRLVAERGERAKSSALRAAIEGTRPDLVYRVSMDYFNAFPDYVIGYWASDLLRKRFQVDDRLGTRAMVRCGMNTGDNAKFVRYWWEPGSEGVWIGAQSEEQFRSRRTAKWCGYNKGGEARRWWGNQLYVLRFDRDASSLLEKQGNHLPSRDLYFRSSVSWSKIGGATFRLFPEGFVFDGAGMSVFVPDGGGNLECILGFLNSSSCREYLDVLAPTINVQSGDVSNIPAALDFRVELPWVAELVEMFRWDWNRLEISLGFRSNPVISLGLGDLSEAAYRYREDAKSEVDRAAHLESVNNDYFAGILKNDAEIEVAKRAVSLMVNTEFRHPVEEGESISEMDSALLFDLDLARELVSYAVGCIMGRYSLDEPGLILADAGSTIVDFEVKVPNARFRPDEDGIVPITATAYFEDDIVSRVREFLSVAFGEENLTANVSWIEHALGSGKRKELRQYFLKDFYNDHLKMYSNRPIYWQVSSNAKTEKGFNALIYLHRYTPATLGILRENYANDMLDKQEARLTTIEHALDTADKAEATKLRKERDTLTEMRRDLQDWVTATLFPLSTAEIALDLDDGVKQNYPKLGAVLKYVKGLS